VDEGQTILVVDDEPALIDVVTYSLRQAGFNTASAGDGQEALRMVDEARPALVVLDLMLPGVGGLAVCRMLRQRRPDLPIIMLTALASELDTVLGLESGADDYVTKPFSPRELVARVRAVLRRAPSRGAEEDGRPDPSTKPGGRELSESAAVLRPGLILDRRGREVRRDGRAVPLTPTEFEILKALADHPGEAMSRRALFDLVWGEDDFGDERVIDVHIRHLREKLERNPSEPELLLTLRGYGYKLRPAAREER